MDVGGESIESDLYAIDVNAIALIFDGVYASVALSNRASLFKAT